MNRERQCSFIKIVTLIFVTCMLIWMSSASSYAAISYPIKVGSSISFSQDDYVTYGTDYTKSGTYKMYGTSTSDSTKRSVYCLQPWLENPGSGKRTVSAIYDATTTNNYAEAIRIMMYYSQKYPGSSWANSNWYINRAGSTYDMAWVSSEEEKTSVMHIATSMAYWQWKNDGKALSKMPAYTGGTVKGYTYDKYWNAAYAVYQASLRAAKGSTGTFTLDGATIMIPPVAPNSFAVAVIKVSGKQDLIYGVTGVKMTGTIALNKISSNTEFTNGNSEYNFDGIEYAVYTNSSCTTKATSSALLPGGSVLVNEGTYYIREFKTNEKYKLSSELFTVDVGVNKTVNISASDEPHATTVSFNKTSTSNRPRDVDLSGFKFSMTGQWSTTAPTFTAVSDKNGKVTFSDIPYGTYRLTEDVASIEAKNESIEDGFFQKGESIDCTIKVSGPTDELITAVNPFVSNPTEFSVNVSKEIETEDGNPIATISKEGFQFKLNGTSNKGEEVELYATTDSNGNVKFSDVPLGTYEVEEILRGNQNNYFISKDGSKTVILDKKDKYLTMTNVVKTTELILRKTSTDNRVSGIEFTLTGEDFEGNTIQPVEAYTDNDGLINFGRILPGTYYIEETDFDDEAYVFDSSYRLAGFDNPAVMVELTGNEDSKTVSFENTNYSVSLTKTEVLEDGTCTSDPIQGAEFALFKVIDNENEYQCSDVIATDENGEVSFTVNKGSYRLREVTVPGGYINTNQNEYIDVTVSDSNPNPSVAMTNKRDYGSISIYKYDSSNEYPIPDAGFSLYRDAACTDLIDSFELTNSRGETTIENLPWGTYYIKETRVPRGYRELENPIEVKLGRWYDEEDDSYHACIDAELSVPNDEILGKVRLKKVDEETEQIIKNNPATFSLYTSDGDLVQEDITTDNNGYLTVDELPWGAYYFSETAAPIGYGLLTEPVRFTVNSYSANETEYQEITAADPVLSNSIVATKSIVAADVWYEHGTPTFMFTLSGTDINGKSHTYNKPVTFSEEYVEKHTALNGTVSMSVTFNDITSGTYTLSEGETDRYSFGSISSVSNNGAVNGDTVEFNLIADNPGETVTGFATFNNVKTDWNDYSDQTELTNAIKKSKKFTAIKADYFGSTELEANMPFSEEDIKESLKVYALYDDGTERRLGDNEYSVTDEFGDTITATPKVGGIYSVLVTHEEKGVTKQDTFTYKVSAPIRLTVSFNSNGGSSLNPVNVYKYDSIQQTVTDPNLYTTSRTGYDFDGWYKDSELNTAFSLDEAITESITVYAKWTEKMGVLRYDANGGSFTIAPSDQTLRFTEAANLTNAEPARTGYEFLGWSDVATATSAKWTKGAVYKNANALTNTAGSVVIPNGATVYAVWKSSSATLVYDANGGSLGSVPETQIMTTTDETKISTAIPTRTGYTFIGWTIYSWFPLPVWYPGDTYKNADSLTNVLDTTVIPNGATVYAVWVAQSATVTYDANTSAVVSDMPDDDEMTYDSAAYASGTVPTRTDGYAFIGWSTTQEAELNDDWYDSGELIKRANVVPEDITLYAQWYDVDSLEKKINSSVRSGDFGITKYKSASTTVSSGSNKSFTLDTLTGGSTLPSDRKNLGSCGFYSSDEKFNIFAADNKDLQVNNNDVSNSQSGTFNNYILNVLMRNGQATTGSVDARICLMQNTAKACLVNDDIQVITTVKDNISTDSLTNHSVTFTPTLADHSFVANVGWSTTNASSSGTRWALNNFYRAYKSGDDFIMAFRNKSTVASKVKITLYSMMVKNKSVGTDIEWIPDLERFDSRSQARLVALNKLESQASEFFTSDNLVRKTVSWTNISPDGTSGSTGSKVLTLEDSDRIIGVTGFDYDNGSASTSKYVGWTEPKGFYVSEIGSGSSSATIYHREAGNYSNQDSKWYQPVKEDLTVTVLCIVR